MPGKTLVLTSCSQEKLDHPAPAIDLYQGKLFQKVKQYAHETGSDLRILSAKYGLVTPEQVLEPYDLQIKGRAQIDPLQATVLPALASIWNNYALVVVIMGAQYCKVIHPILHRQGEWKLDPLVNVVFLHDERGIGGLLQKVNLCIAAVHAEREREKALGDKPIQEPYTRIVSPDTCLTCTQRNQAFNPFRKCALPNGEENPLSTACDYCCKWDGVPNPDQYQKDRNVKPMAEQPEPEKTDESNNEPEPSEFGRICGGCGKPIKPGTKNMVQDPHTKRWFHAEHYGQDERHQESDDLCECIACSKEFPETEMHRDRDGETWCKACWAAEHPRKPRAKKEKPATPEIKTLRFRGNWVYLDESHLNELEDEALGKILYAYDIPFHIMGPTKAQMIAAILEAPVGGIMGEHVEGKTIPLQADIDRGLYPGVKAVCDTCQQKIYRDEQMIVQGSTSPAIPFHAECHPKREILYHCVFDCAKFRECGVHYVKGCKEFTSKVSQGDKAELGEAKDEITGKERERALAGQRLYQIFAMHAAQIAALLSKEEQGEMNQIAGVLEIA